MTRKLHEDRQTFVITRKVFQAKVVGKNKKAHFIFGNFPPPPTPQNQNRTVYEISGKNIVQPDRPLITVRSMRIASWLTRHTDTQNM